jgi:hypothetical protein
MHQYGLCVSLFSRSKKDSQHIARHDPPAKAEVTNDFDVVPHTSVSITWLTVGSIWYQVEKVNINQTSDVR